MSPKSLMMVVAATSALYASLTPIAVAAQAPAPFLPLPQGIALNGVDAAADPCTDFDAFANGAWRAANPLPAGTRRWSRRSAWRAANRAQVQSLLEELAAKGERPLGSVEQQLGDFFAACVDQSAIDAAGLEPLAPLLAEINDARDLQGVQRLIRRLHDLAIPAPFGANAISDYRDPEKFVLNFLAGGLTLPDRDHYLMPEPRFAEARQQYRAHLASVLTTAGAVTGTAEQAADEIIALESRLAEASLAPAAAADPAGTAHKLTFTQLAQLAPNFDWESYFSEAGLPRIPVNIAEPAFVERLNRELAATPVTVWKAYLTWHLLKTAAPWLSRPFADAPAEFRDEFLGGAAALKPRPQRCLEATEELLGEPLGQVYAERHFPPAAKARVQEMVRNLTTVLKEELQALQWMSEATKEQALAKIASYEVKVGYPDAFTDHSTLVIRRDTFWANMVAARRFGVEVWRQRIGQRTVRALWQLPASAPAAYIDIQPNLMVLPAGFLQPWSFDLGASDAVNYGAIGAGVAHDLTHAIDTLGAEFDAAGQPRNWWTEPDRAAFTKLGQCTIDQYNGYEIEPGVNHQGTLVLSEARGDLAGVRLAFLALKRSMERRPVPIVHGFSPEQQFFIAWGQFRGAAESLDLQREMVKTDSHPTARYRVIGPLSNLPEFQQAFACKAESPMVRPVERRCVAW